MRTLTVATWFCLELISSWHFHLLIACHLEQLLFLRSCASMRLCSCAGRCACFHVLRWYASPHPSHTYYYSPHHFLLLKSPLSSLHITRLPTTLSPFIYPLRARRHSPLSLLKSPLPNVLVAPPFSSKVAPPLSPAKVGPPFYILRIAPSLSSKVF